MVLRQLIFVCIRSKRACNLCGACAFHILATRTDGTLKLYNALCLSIYLDGLTLWNWVDIPPENAT